MRERHTLRDSEEVGRQLRHLNAGCDADCWRAGQMAGSAVVALQGEGAVFSVRMMLVAAARRSGVVAQLLSRCRCRFIAREGRALAVLTERHRYRGQGLQRQPEEQQQNHDRTKLGHVSAMLQGGPAAGKFQQATGVRHATSLCGSWARVAGGLGRVARCNSSGEIPARRAQASVIECRIALEVDVTATLRPAMGFVKDCTFEAPPVRPVLRCLL